MGTEGMRASLVSREVIADSIELFAMAHMLDGIVALSGCDKTLPGTVMALARLDVPSLMLYGGPIAPGRFEGRDVTIQDVFEAVGSHAAGKMTESALRLLEDRACPGAGSCGGQYTANTMATAISFLGLSPMGFNEVPATDPRKGDVARECGKIVMRLVQKDVRPRSFITRESIENAIASAAATAGSTNAVLHLLAIAHEAGVPLRIDDFDPISARTPVVADLKPGGRFTAVDMHRAGGERLLGACLMAGGLLRDTPTVTGRNLFEEISDAREAPGQQVVRGTEARPSSRVGASRSCEGRSRRRGASSSWPATTGIATSVRRACSTGKKLPSRPCRRESSSPGTSSSSATRDRAADPGCARCWPSRRRSSAVASATRSPS